MALRSESLMPANAPHGTGVPATNSPARKRATNSSPDQRPTGLLSTVWSEIRRDVDLGRIRGDVHSLSAREWRTGQRTVFSPIGVALYARRHVVRQILAALDSVTRWSGHWCRDRCRGLDGKCHQRLAKERQAMFGHGMRPRGLGAQIRNRRNELVVGE